MWFFARLRDLARTEHGTACDVHNCSKDEACCSEGGRAARRRAKRGSPACETVRNALKGRNSRPQSPCWRRERRGENSDSRVISGSGRGNVADWPPLLRCSRPRANDGIEKQRRRSSKARPGSIIKTPAPSRIWSTRPVLPCSPMQKTYRLQGSRSKSREQLRLSRETWLADGRRKASRQGKGSMRIAWQGSIRSEKGRYRVFLLLSRVR